MSFVAIRGEPGGRAALRKRGVGPMAQLAQWVPGRAEDAAGRARLLFFIDSVIQGFAAHRHLEASFMGDMRFPDVEALSGFYIGCGLRLPRDQTHSS